MSSSITGMARPQFTRLWHNGMWQAYSGVVSGAEVAGVFSQPERPC